MEINLSNKVKLNALKVLNFVTNSKLDSREVRTKSDSVDINNVMDAVDSLFDLGDSNSFSWLKLNEAEQRKFWEIVRKLIKAGIIGYRYYEVNGHLERRFIELEMVDPRLARAKVKYVDKRQYTRDWFV